MTEAQAKRLRNAPTIQRLLFRTVKQASGCWIWTGSTNTKGYGHIRSDMGGPLVSVHRVTYQEFVGEIPDGLEIDHLCGVRSCVNPSHLEAVDHKTNVLRGRHNQFHGVTHCVHGHEFTDENTKRYMRDGQARRSCRACSRERTAKYRRTREAT